MMKFPQTISLSKAIIVPYFGLVMLFLSFALLVYFLVATLHMEYESFYQKAIPETSEHINIFDKLQQIQSDVFKIINEKTQLVANVELENMKESLTDLINLAAEKANNAVWNRHRENIADLLKAVDVFLIDMEKYVRERNRLIQQRFKNIQEIRYIELSVIDLMNKNKFTDDVLAGLVRILIDDLLILNADVPMYYSIKVYNHFLYYSERLQEYREKENTLISREAADCIDALSETNQAVSMLFLELQKLYNQETSLVIYLNSLSNQTSVVSEKLFDELYLAAEKQNSLMKELMNVLSWFSVGISILSVILIFLIYYFLFKHVLNPVLVLRKFINDRKKNTVCLFAEEKITEVRDISCAIYDFVSQIEENEKSLRESHQNLEKQVLERTEEIRQLSEKIINVSEERVRLAAELHDDIGSSISTIKFGIEHALFLLNESDMGNAKESLDSSVQIVKSVARQLRRIQTDLCPPHLDLGLLKTLEWYIDDYKQTHPSIQIEADFFFDELLLSTPMQIATFRIIQEGMNNIAKHSKATKVVLQVLHEDCYKIIIADNGIGMREPMTAVSGHGLKNIKERVSVSGGEFIIESSAKGTVITAKWKVINK